MLQWNSWLNGEPGGPEEARTTFSKARQASKNVTEKRVMWKLKIVNTVSSFSTSHRHISDTLRPDDLRLSLFTVIFLRIKNKERNLFYGRA